MQKLNYIRCGDYYIPDIRLPEENRPIGRWGRMHRDYIKEHKLIRFNDLCLSGELWTYLADLNEQAQNRMELIIEQMKATEGVTEVMKRSFCPSMLFRSEHNPATDLGFLLYPIG